MTDARLTDLLAERVMGWGVGPDRFRLGNRRWISRWRFRPLEDLSDAFAVLDRAADSFTLASDLNVFTVEVQIGDRRGRASGEPKARTITAAVAQALGLET